MTARSLKLDEAPLAAAARLARDGRLTVRVAVPDTSPRLRLLVELAAEQAGVDCAVEPYVGGTTIHFIARHQDRLVRPDSADRSGSSCPIWDRRRPAPRVLSVSRPHSDRNVAPPRSVDLLAFRRASDALALGADNDAEGEQIWLRLLQAKPRAHVCGGIPTLMLNDIGGLVGVLRRRAETRGALVRVNPNVCCCA